MKTLVKTYARQVLNEKSNISGYDEMVSACKIVARALDRLSVKRYTRS